MFVQEECTLHLSRKTFGAFFACTNRLRDESIIGIGGFFINPFYNTSYLIFRAQ